MKNLTLAISLGLFAFAAHSAEKTALFTVASDVASLQHSDIGSAKKTGETSPVKLKSKASKQGGKALFQISGQQDAQNDAAPVAAAETASKPENPADNAPANPLQALAASGKDAESNKAVTGKKTAKPAVKTTVKKAADNALQTLAAAGKSGSVQTVEETAPKVQTATTADKRSSAQTPVADQPASGQVAATENSKPSEENSESTLFKIASYYEADEMGDSDDAVRKIDFSKPQGQQLPGDFAERRAIADSKAIQLAAPASSKRSSKKGSYSYVVRGKRYQTLASSDDFVQEGPASWYGPGFHGKKTASGEIYDMHKMTAAHKRLPLGTKLEVTNKRTGKTIIVTVNDRGPFHGNRIIDLSHAAASKLGVLRSGVANVTIRAIK